MADLITKVFAINPAPTNGAVVDKVAQSAHNPVRSRSNWSFQAPNPTGNNAVVDSLLPYGLPSSDLIEPQIEPCLKSVDFVETLADVYRRIENCPQFEKWRMYVEQCAIFRGLSDPKLFRRSLRSARQHAVDVHSKVVLAAWLRYERREDELVGSSSMTCCGRNVECPKASLVAGYDPESVYDSCCCSRSGVEEADGAVVGETSVEECSTSKEEDADMSFYIGEDELRCVRYKIAALSTPFRTMLYGGFTETRREKINFTQNGVSPEAMRAVEIYSRTGKLDSFEVRIVLDMLSFSNRFCCDELKSACDAHLASLVCELEDAMVLIDYGLEEMAYLLVAACLQVFLRELPKTTAKTDLDLTLIMAELPSLPEVLMIIPLPAFTHFESDFTQKFNILRAWESPLPLDQYLTTHAHSAKALLCRALTAVNADLLQLLPSLKLMVSVSTGANHVDKAECRRRGIAVTNAGNAYSEDVADLAVGLFIDVCRECCTEGVR